MEKPGLKLNSNQSGVKLNQGTRTRSTLRDCETRRNEMELSRVQELIVNTLGVCLELGCLELSVNSIIANTA